MKTVILEVRAPKDTMAGFVNAWKTGRAEKSARIAFASPELLWQVLTAKRWELLKALCGIGPVSIREAARRVGRDVKAVHGDVTALLNAGVLDRAVGGGIIFPFDAVKVEFMLKAALFRCSPEAEHFVAATAVGSRRTQSITLRAELPQIPFHSRMIFSNISTD